MQKTTFTVANATSQGNYITAYGKIRIVDLSFRPSVILQATQTYSLYTISLSKPTYPIDIFTMNSLGHKYRIQITTGGVINISPFDDIAVGELILANMAYAI